MATFEERLVAGLLSRGWVEGTRSSRYRICTHPTLPGKAFVGPNGALRRGTTASGSWSVGDPARRTTHWTNVLADGDKALGLTPEGGVDTKRLLGGLAE